MVWYKGKIKTRDEAGFDCGLFKYGLPWTKRPVKDRTIYFREDDNGKILVHPIAPGGQCVLEPTEAFQYIKPVLNINFGRCEAEVSLNQSLEESFHRYIRKD